MTHHFGAGAIPRHEPAAGAPRADPQPQFSQRNQRGHRRTTAQKSASDCAIHDVQETESNAFAFTAFTGVLELVDGLYEATSQRKPARKATV